MSRSNWNLLTFTVVSTDGGQYSNSYKCENMLLPDANVYCTKKRENTNVLLQFAEYESRGPFVLTHIVVKAPEHGFSAPIGEALIFVSHEPIVPSSTSAFDGFDANKWKQFLERKKQNKEQLTEADPACYFNLHEGWCFVQKLDLPRSGRYVLVKLLRSRQPSSENVDVQFIGFKGFVGAQAFGYGELC